MLRQGERVGNCSGPAQLWSRRVSSALEAIADISEPVREMLIEAVERRFGSVDAVPAGHVLEFLSDNGAAYIAADTRALARSLGLKPINRPVCSPQSNGMAESFVNTFKRDYVARMDLRDARTVLAQLPAAFEHFNERHPHSSLKMRSPREFRRQQAARAPETSDGPGALLRLGRGAGNTGATSKTAHGGVSTASNARQRYTSSVSSLRARRRRCGLGTGPALEHSASMDTRATRDANIGAACICVFADAN